MPPPPTSDSSYHQRAWDPAIGHHDDAAEPDSTQDASLIAIAKGLSARLEAIETSQASIVANQASIITLLTSIDTRLSGSIDVNIL